MPSLRSNPLATLARTVVQSRSAAAPSFRRSTPTSLSSFNSQRSAPFARSYSTAKEEKAETVEGEVVNPEAEAKAEELMKELEEKNKLIAELRDARLRSLADFENLQKISTREKALAKDFALTSFARDLISSIDILSLAIKSIPEHKIVAGHADAPANHTPNEDLVSLHEGVSLTKKAIERVLKRHGVTPFDPTGEAFDPNIHEALYQAPVPGKTAGTVLECQEIGYMIKDRLLRPAKVGVVLGEES